MFVDVNKIFDLFNNKEPDSLKEKIQDNDILITDYKNHPLFWISFLNIPIQYIGVSFISIKITSSLDFSSEPDSNKSNILPISITHKYKWPILLI